MPENIKPDRINPDSIDSGGDFIPRPDPCETRAAAPGLEASANERLHRLRGLVVKERQVAEKALAETLAAREERDLYRRVLAASLRGESLVGERCTGLEQALQQSEALLAESTSRLGRLEGVNSELGKRIDTQGLTQAEELAALQAQWQAERVRLEGKLAEAAAQRGEAQGRLTEVQHRLAQELPNFAHFMRVRAIGLFVCSGIAAAGAIAFLWPLARMLYGSPDAQEMLLAVGMAPWTLVGTECVLLGASLVLLNRGIRAFKSSERSLD